MKFECYTSTKMEQAVCKEDFASADGMNNVFFGDKRRTVGVFYHHRYAATLLLLGFVVSPYSGSYQRSQQHGYCRDV